MYGERDRERDDNTIHGNISCTWHGCSWAIQSYYSSPCIYHILLLFQHLCPKIAYFPLHLFFGTFPYMLPSAFCPHYQLHLFEVEVKRDKLRLATKGREDIIYQGHNKTVNPNKLVLEIYHRTL